jgi:hypothetical protein
MASPSNSLPNRLFEYHSLSPDEEAILFDNLTLFSPGATGYDSAEYDRNIHRMTMIFINALCSLVLRLWLSTVSISLLMYLIKRIPVNHLKHHSGAYISDQEAMIQYNSIVWTSTPALFGRILEEPIRGAHFPNSGPIKFVNHDGCSPFTVKFPNITEKYIDSDNFEQVVDYKNSWIGIIQRGGCPFDQKVLHMQEAGFKATVVLHQYDDFSKNNIRMSAHSLGDSIEIFASFIDRKQGINLISNILSKALPPIVTIKPSSLPWLSQELILAGFIDMLILFLLVLTTGTIFLLVGFSINILHNYYHYGRFNIEETIHDAAMLIISGDMPIHLPKLDKITFPSRKLTLDDLETDWRYGGVLGQDSCAICLEDFIIGNQVRELPCKHNFHDIW